MAQWTGKLVGGILGLALGPVGALAGVFLGHQYDEKVRREEDANARARLSPLEVGEHLFRSAFRVMGHVAKADGRVSEREVAAARAVMSDLRLNPLMVRTAIAHFTDGKAADFDLQAELTGLRAICAGRPELLRVFLEIQLRAALAGNDLQGPSRLLMQRVANVLGISMLELAQMEAVLRIRGGSFSRAGPVQSSDAEQMAQAYRVLETTPEASNAEVAKAYRRQLSRHHPDKLKANGLPDSMIEHAKQRTQQIIEAYELIKERRGM